jgi:hypothetical protein
MTSFTLEGVTQITLPLDGATNKHLTTIHQALSEKLGVDATPVDIIRAAVRMAAEMEAE